jgi:hypothetical protein
MDVLPDLVARTRRGLLGPVAVLEVCACLYRIASFRPALVASSAKQLYAALNDHSSPRWFLDEKEFLKGVLSLSASIAARYLGHWAAAFRWLTLGSRAFRRSADASDVQRIEVERLALLYSRIDNEAIVAAAPALLETLTIPRERLKAQLVFAGALLGMNRLGEALTVLETARRCSEGSDEAGLLACLFMKMGEVCSHMGRSGEAVAHFNRAGAILGDFHYPSQFQILTAAMAEHLGGEGELERAAHLYAVSREMAKQVGYAPQVGYLTVLRAELLMMLGKCDEAEAELRAVAPLLEDFDLRREGLAAIQLMKDALARRRLAPAVPRLIRDRLKKETKE